MSCLALLAAVVFVFIFMDLLGLVPSFIVYRERNPFSVIKPTQNDVLPKSVEELVAEVKESLDLQIREQKLLETHIEQLTETNKQLIDQISLKSGQVNQRIISASLVDQVNHQSVA